MHRHLTKCSVLLLIGLFGFTNCKVNHIAKTEFTNYRLDLNQSIQPDSAIAALIDPYRDKLQEEMDQIIGYSVITMHKAKPEGTLCNWFADTQKVQAEKYSNLNIDISIMNYGGIRIPSLEKGAITKGKMFEIMPFDNTIVVLDIPGTIAKKLFDRMAADGGWPVNNGVSYKIKNGKAESIWINGHLLDANKIYKLCLPNFIADGGGNCFFLLECKRTETGHLLRDALIDYIVHQHKEGKEITSQLEGRVEIIE